MPQPNEFLANLLRRGGGAFAGFAAAEMLETQAHMTNRGPDLLSLWMAWFVDRVDELAAAISAGKPDLFTEQARWATSLLASRNVPNDEVERAFDALRRVLAKELPENAQSLADEYLSSAVSALGPLPSTSTTLLAADTDEGQLAASYLLTLLEGDRQKAISIIHAAASEGWSVPDLYSRVLAPAQREIGRMWLDNEINVADEHLATSTTKIVMSQLRRCEQTHSSNGKTVVAAAVPDNQHDVGLQMVADIFEMHGWRTIPLGANVPIPDLVQATEAFQADLLLISAALSKHLDAVHSTIRAMRQHDPSKDTKILVGGMAFAAVPELAEQYGADGYAGDPGEALQLGEQLVGL